MKKFFSLILAVLMIVSVVPKEVRAVNYDADAAVAYAASHWDDGIEQCAGFVSNCLKAGGIDVFERVCNNLFDALKNSYGVAYELTVSSNRIPMADNEGKIAPGDPVFYFCNTCNSHSHVVLCSGTDANGYAKDYAHNAPHNDATSWTSWECSSCNTCNWTMYSVHLSEKEIQAGDLIEFGSYPQAEEKDPAIIAALNSLAPEWNKWTSYGYYSGDGNIGSMKQGDWMRYVDVPYDGATYRGVKFTEYRPFHTWKVVSESNTYQSANGYKTNTIYWFKFEPIKWKVLDPNTGLVLSELLIDSQAFNNEIYGNGNIYSTHYGDAEKKNKANKYETSSIRAWLNYNFYNVAFSDKEELKMLPYGNVADRVVLLSTSEVTNSNYGFNANSGAYDEARRGVGSDYAKSQGLYLYENGTNKGNSYWILRTAGDYSVHCKEVTYSCNITNDFGWNVATTNNGIRPAIVLKTLDVNAPCQHPNATNVPQLDPNCIDIGFTAGVYCNDCATWLSGHEVIAVGDHKDNTGDGKCDTCLKQLSTPSEPEQPKKNIVQKVVDAVKNAFNNFINFFKKLFGR